MVEVARTWEFIHMQFNMTLIPCNLYMIKVYYILNCSIQ